MGFWGDTPPYSLYVPYTCTIIRHSRRASTECRVVWLQCTELLFFFLFSFFLFFTLAYSVASTDVYTFDRQAGRSRSGAR